MELPAEDETPSGVPITFAIAALICYDGGGRVGHPTASVADIGPAHYLNRGALWPAARLVCYYR